MSSTDTERPGRAGTVHPGRHAGETALVTGGARGIGAGIVTRLAAEGAHVFFTYASAAAEADALVADVEAVGGRANAIAANSGDREQVRQLVDAVLERNGRLDIVVSNAGGGTIKRTDDLSDDEIDRMIDVNIRGTVDLHLRARTSGPVILVGHSYGGAVSGAAGLVATDVRALVYVNAFVPAEGESLLDLLNSVGPVDPTQLFDMAPYPGAPEGDVDLYIQRGPFEPAFATGLSDELQTEFYAKQRPITFAAVGAKAAPGQAWERLPSWYVAGTLDGSIPLDLQLRMAERAGAAVTEVRAGHLSMVSHPREVADVIEAAAHGPAQ